MQNQNNNRSRMMIITSWVSIIGNAILSILKIVIGVFAGSLAVLSDGIDSATDVIISLVTLFAAKIVNKPPSLKYAYGYEKADTVATKFLAFVIFFAGIQMLITSGKSIFQPGIKEMPSTIAIYVTVFSIFGKLILAWNQFYQGKKLNSPMLIANAKNMRNDVLISSGVLLGLIFTFVLKLPILDSITSLLISFFIIKTSWDIFWEANIVLMDGIKDTSIYKKIFEATEQVPGAENPHRVRSRQIGPMYMIVLDVEVDGDLPLKEAHRIAHAVEDSIRNHVDNVYDIVVHVEPKGDCRDAEKFGITKDSID